MGYLFAVLLAFSTPCPTEDSTYCTWDAQIQGNGAGTSLINFTEGATFYLTAPGTVLPGGPVGSPVQRTEPTR